MDVSLSWMALAWTAGRNALNHAIPSGAGSRNTARSCDAAPCRSATDTGCTRSRASRATRPSPAGVRCVASRASTAASKAGLDAGGRSSPCRTTWRACRSPISPAPMAPRTAGRCSVSSTEVSTRVAMAPSEAPIVVASSATSARRACSATWEPGATSSSGRTGTMTPGSSSVTAAVSATSAERCADSALIHASSDPTMPTRADSRGSACAGSTAPARTWASRRCAVATMRMPRSGSGRPGTSLGPQGGATTARESPHGPPPPATPFPIEPAIPITSRLEQVYDTGPTTVPDSPGFPPSGPAPRRDIRPLTRPRPTRAARRRRRDPPTSHEPTPQAATGVVGPHPSRNPPAAAR